MPNETRSLAELLEARATLLEQAARQRAEARALHDETHRLAWAVYEHRCQAHEAMLVALHRLAMLRLHFAAPRDAIS